MSHSPSDFSEVPRDPLAAASLIQRQIVDERDCLPKAMNGSPMLCSDRRAILPRKKMQRGESAAVRNLMLVSGCDVRDGVPVATAAEPYRQIISFLHLCAKPQRPRDLSALWTAETKAQCRLDLAQQRVREHPDDIDALRDVIAAHAEYEAASEALRIHYETRLLIAAGTTQRPMRIAR